MNFKLRDSENSYYLEACNDCFIFGLIVGESEPDGVRLLNDGSFWRSEDYPNSGALVI